MPHAKLTFAPLSCASFYFLHKTIQTIFSFCSQGTYVEELDNEKNHVCVSHARATSRGDSDGGSKVHGTSEIMMGLEGECAPPLDTYSHSMGVGST